MFVSLGIYHGINFGIRLAICPEICLEICHVGKSIKKKSWFPGIFVRSTSWRWT
jgi:hypothetical protein